MRTTNRDLAALDFHRMAAKVERLRAELQATDDYLVDARNASTNEEHRRELALHISHIRASMRRADAALADGKVDEARADLFSTSANFFRVPLLQRVAGREGRQ